MEQRNTVQYLALYSVVSVCLTPSEINIDILSSPSARCLG